MSIDRAPPGPFELVLYSPTNDSTILGLIEGSARHAVQDLLKSLGLNEDIGLQARCIAKTDPMRISLNGRNFFYPDVLARWTWEAVMGTHLKMHPSYTELADCLSSKPDECRDAAIDFMAMLTQQTLLIRPDRLLGQQSITDMLTRIRKLGVVPPEADFVVARAMRILLELGLSCAPDPLVEQMAQIAVAKNPEDLIEQLVALVRSRSIELRFNRIYLENLFDRNIDDEVQLRDGGESGAILDELLRATILQKTGFQAAGLRASVDDKLLSATVQITIGGLPGPVMPLPDLKLAEPSASLSTKPQSSISFSQPLPVRLKPLVEQLDRGLAYLMPRLFDTLDVESALAELNTTHGRLIATAMAHVTLPQLVRLMRALVREKVDTRNLRMILERLVVFSTIAAPMQTAYPLDGSLLIDDRIEESKRDMDTARLEFVRIGLRDAILAKLPAGTRPFRVKSELDAQLASHIASSSNGETERGVLTDSKLDALRTKLIAEIGSNCCNAVVTLTATRLFVYNLICDALPDIIVLSDAEIRGRFTPDTLTELEVSAHLPVLQASEGHHAALNDDAPYDSDGSLYLM